MCAPARQLIVQLGLYPVWYKKLGVLSTGEVRKVLLALTLSKSPPVVVLDKPYDGLDAPSRDNLKAILSQLCQVSLSLEISRVGLLLAC
jgi:ABC-type multidrug transport system ATPase subunit